MGALFMLTMYLCDNHVINCLNDNRHPLRSVAILAPDAAVDDDRFRGAAGLGGGATPKSCSMRHVMHGQVSTPVCRSFRTSEKRSSSMLL